MNDEEIARYALMTARQQILLDLIPKYVIQTLRNNDAINSEQFWQIAKEPEIESQVLKLLDFIGENGPDALQQLVATFRLDNAYPWLADVLVECQSSYATYQERMNCMMREGAVPLLPQNMCARPHLRNRLRQKLKMIYNGADTNEMSRWVVTWGMAGEGKTVLNASVLRDPLLIKELGIEHIYWLKIGCRMDDDTLRKKIHSLCERIDRTYRNSPSNDLEVAVDRLQTIFSDESYKDSLLVLDDVWDESVIRHFDFGCHFMITTRDRSVMDKVSKQCHFVDMRDEVVSLDNAKQFFARSLDIGIETLPEQTLSKIYCKVKGSIIVLAQICSFVCQHHNSIEAAFEQCDCRLRQIVSPKIPAHLQFDGNIFFNVFALSYDTLDNDMKEYFTDLAIFPRTCSISSKVLSSLWRINTFDVELIMQTFTNKSIANLDQRDDSTTYYSIHDLCYQFIRNRDGHTLAARHKNLIDIYLEQSRNSFERLPDDGYILKHLCYHLCEANMQEKIPNVLLNLKVLGTMLQAVSPADVLGNFVRYRENICYNAENIQKYEDFKRFIQQELFYLSSKTIDPIQIALNQPNNSEVFKNAKALGLQSPETPYFIWKNRHNINASSNISTKLHSGKVLSAIFSTNDRFVISAGEDRVIKIWDSNTGQEALRLIGHTATINCLCSYFNHETKEEVIISCSENCAVKIWHASLESLRTANSRGGLETEIKCTWTFSEHQTNVNHCSVANNGIIAASLDDNGIIKIWIPETGVEIRNTYFNENSPKVCSCSLSSDGKLIVVAATKSLHLWNLNKGVEIRKRMLISSEKVTYCCFSADDSEIITIMASYKKKTPYEIGSSIVGFSVQSGSETFRFRESYFKELISCSMSVDGSFIAAVAKTKFVVVWSRTSQQMITHHTHFIGNVLSVAFERSKHLPQTHEQYRLASANTLGGVVIWQSSEEGKRLWTQKRNLCQVQFSRNDKPTIIDNIRFKIQFWDVVNNETAAIATCSNGADGRITCCYLSIGRDKVLYGTALGHLRLLDVGNLGAQPERIFSNKSLGSTTHCLINGTDDTYVGAYSSGNVVIVCKGAPPNLITCHKHQLTHLIMYGNDKYLLTSSIDHPITLKVWDIKDGRLTFSCVGHLEAVTCCDVNEYRNLIVSAATDKPMLIWDSDNGAKLIALTGHAQYVLCCKFLAGSDWLATGDSIGYVHLWHVDQKQIETARTGNSVDFPQQITTLQPFLTLKASIKGTPISGLDFCLPRLELVTCSDVIRWYGLAKYLGSDVTSTETVERYPKATQTFFIKGMETRQIFCSKNFNTFVAVDNTGVMYYLSRLSDEPSRRHLRYSEISYMERRINTRSNSF